MHAVYIHIPFCKTICSYCDFCKVFYDEKLVDIYLENLREEIISLYRGELINTLYVGGGTPSCLNVKQLQKLFDILRVIKYEKEVEFTFECNVENITEEKLEILYFNKVNRLSIGVQTLNGSFLNFLNRNHTVEEVKEKIKCIKKIGFKNINVDFMYAFPNQTQIDVKKDLEKFMELDVPHISTYSLILEPHTKLYISKTKEIEEDLERDMYDSICSILEKNHYTHYEISNFGRMGYESKHNLVYWNNESYYGFGAGASGYIDNIRYDNTRSITAYIKGQRIKEREVLTLQKKIENELILGFRKTKGISKAKFYQKYHIDLIQMPIIKEAIQQNKLMENKTYVYIDPKYTYVMNEILIDFIDREEEYYGYSSKQSRGF